ncbi:MAG TPA: hypothetical protein VNZ64_14190 [Candidatus Acidoferrum sp.]|nr:hypothetical protein [Candidatus Acidoferrum sp.]
MNTNEREVTKELLPGLRGPTKRSVVRTSEKEAHTRWIRVG